MPPGVFFTLVATSAEPATPDPALPGHGLSTTSLPQSPGSLNDRYFSKFLFVPDGSLRKKTLMADDGRFTPWLMPAIAGSFHFVILPRKILVRTCGVSVRSVTP